MSRKKTTFADEHYNPSESSMHPLEDVSYHRDLHYTDIRERAALALTTLNNYNWFLLSGQLIRANKEDIVDNKFINNGRTTVLRPSDGIAKEMLRKGKSWIRWSTLSAELPWNQPVLERHAIVPEEEKRPDEAHAARRSGAIPHTNFPSLTYDTVLEPGWVKGPDGNKMRRRSARINFRNDTVLEPGWEYDETEGKRRISPPGAAEWYTGATMPPSVRHMGRNTTNPLESHTAGAAVGKIAGRVCKIMADGVKRCFNNPPNLVGIGSKFRGGKRTRRKKDKRKKRKTRRRRKGSKITRKIKKHNRGKKFKKKYQKK